MRSLKKVVYNLLVMCMVVMIFPICAYADGGENTLSIDGTFRYQDTDGQYKPIPYAELKMTHSDEETVFGGTITDGALTLDLDTNVAGSSMVYGTYNVTVSCLPSSAIPISCGSDAVTVDFEENKSVGNVDFTLMLAFPILAVDATTEETMNFSWQLQKSGNILDCGTGTQNGASVTAPWEDCELLLQAEGYINRNISITPCFINGSVAIMSNVSLQSPIHLTPDSGDLGTGVNWKWTDGTLTFSGNGAIPDYSSHLDQPWVDLIWSDPNNTITTDIVIEPGITRIGTRALAFYTGNQLSLTIPDTVTTIGQIALGFTSLRELTIPASVRTIEFDAFDCSENMTVKFLGDAPEFKDTGSDMGVPDGQTQVFWRSKGITILYPAGNRTWDKWIGNNLGAEDTITWTPYGNSGDLKYAVIFETSGGNEIESVLVEAGTIITLPTPTRTGYTFRGWKIMGTDTVCPAGTSYTVTTQSTLVAQWQVSGETVPGSTSGGNSSSSNSIYTVSTPSKVENGTVKVTPKSAGKGDTVTITVTPDQNYEVNEVIVTDKNGRDIDLKDQGNGKYTFTMPASKVNIAVTFIEIEEQPKVSFTDVSTSAYYYDAVEWAVANGITSGTSTATFSPNETCTRAQAMTFLWKAAGSPEPKNTENPFADVLSSNYYCKAVLWAVEQGITAGTSATTFSPDETCTRAQTMTFLYRTAGTSAAGNNPFTDVADSAYYADAVKWAVAEGITAGTSAATFSPDQACTRAHIVTFLMKFCEYTAS